MKGVIMVVTAQIIKKNGEGKFAVLPYKEFKKYRNSLLHTKTFNALEAKIAEKDAPTIGIAALKKEL